MHGETVACRQALYTSLVFLSYLAKWIKKIEYTSSPAELCCEMFQKGSTWCVSAPEIMAFTMKLRFTDSDDDILREVNKYQPRFQEQSIWQPSQPSAHAAGVLGKGWGISVRMCAHTHISSHMQVGRANLGSGSPKSRMDSTTACRSNHCTFPHSQNNVVEILCIKRGRNKRLPARGDRQRPPGEFSYLKFALQWPKMAAYL